MIRITYFKKTDLKKLFLALTTILLMSILELKAQNNEIIYIDYEPDLDVTGSMNEVISLYFDMNGDNVNDVRIYYIYSSSCPTLNITTVDTDNWFLCNLDSYGISDETSFSEIDTWSPINLWIPNYGERFAVKHVSGDNVYYGWFRPYLYWQGIDIAHMCLDKSVYCTVPNHDMHYGQIDLNGMEETSEVSCASVHPNPTDGSVTIAGGNFSHIEVLSITGQTVLKSECLGDNITIDLEGQPAGVYFFNIADRKGNRCTRMVVKN